MTREPDRQTTGSRIAADNARQRAATVTHAPKADPDPTAHQTNMRRSKPLQAS